MITFFLMVRVLMGLPTTCGINPYCSCHKHSLASYKYRGYIQKIAVRIG
jgi:hypothetical protein